MEVKTKNYGIIPYQEGDIISFAGGIPGLSDLKNFLILAYEEMKPFKFMQSIDNPLISFILVNPLLLDPVYACELQPEDYQDLELAEDESILLYIIVTVPNDPQQVTGNFVAPIVINTRNMKGKQVLLKKSPYSARASMPEILNRQSLNFEKGSEPFLKKTAH